MGVISNALLLEKGLRAEFMKAFNNGESPQDVASLILETTSSANSEKYGWLGEVAAMNSWDDERILRGLNDFNFTIANRDYESTLKVDKNVMEDDQLGAVKLRIRDLALRAKTHSRKLVFDGLVSGTTDLCYDGQALFSTSHVEGLSGTQSNLITGTKAGGAYTTAEWATEFKKVRALMRAFKDDQGEPRNEGELGLKVYVSPDLEGVVDEVLTADLLSQTTNTLKGQAGKVVSSRLSGQDWYLADDSGLLKPFILQKRSPIKFEGLESGERAFMRKELLFGVDYRVGFAPGAWYKILKVKF